MGGGDAALRRDADARSSGRGEAASTARSPTRLAGQWRARMRRRRSTRPPASPMSSRGHRAERCRTARGARTFPPPAVSALTHATRAAFERVRALLVARERAGLVRRCHGDLHLGNIVLLDGAPVLFDAIEFDPKIATGDVLYDLAFLLMDLIERGLTPAANIVLNRYLNETRRAEDLDALAALPLFLSLRAAIRAKVAAERRAQGAERAASRKARAPISRLPASCWRRRRRVSLPSAGCRAPANRCSPARSQPKFSPSRARWCCAATSSARLCSGIAETDRLPQTAYSRDVTAQVYAALADKARRVLAAGHSAIVDAVFAEAGERAAIAQAAGRRGVPRAVPDRRSQHPACPRRRPQRRCLRCRHRGRAPARAIRSRRDAMDAGRRLRLAGRRRCARAKAALGLA